MADEKKDEKNELTENANWHDIVDGMPEVEVKLQVEGTGGHTDETGFGVNTLLNLVPVTELPDAEHLQGLVDANLNKLPFKGVVSAKVEYVGGLDEYVEKRKKLAEENGDEFDAGLIAAVAETWDDIKAYREEHDAYMPYTK